MKKVTQVLTVFILCWFYGFESLSQDLPQDFPTVKTIKTGETGEGYIFLTVSSDVEGIGYYVFMIDDDGEVINYRKLDHDYSYDFKVQPSGLTSYAQFLSHHSYTGGGNCIHMVLDEDMNVVDSFQLKSGYIAEAHDFQLLPNGHALAFGYYMTQMDLSDIVDGGYPNALVSGGVVQEFDQNKNVVWQWRSWDYYDKEDYDFGKRASVQTVAQFHLNTINLDTDDNMILARPGSTNKINRQTGDIMWHLGGNENEFSFVGVDSLDGVGDVTGHAFYRLGNGNCLIYDNGPRRGSGTSEAHEFKLDEVNKIAEKIRTFTPDTAIRGWHRGNAQRLSNGNTLVGWGGAAGDYIPTCTEFDSAGNTVLMVYFDDPVTESYRAVRHPYPPVHKHEAFLAIAGEGNTYELMQGDTLDIGLKIKITHLITVGYNELTFTTHDYAPQFPRFLERAPMVLAKRVVMEEFSVNEIGGEISFDAGIFNIPDPEAITIYFRDTVGEGEFMPLPTTYNSVTNEIKAQFENVGEYIFTYPDIEHEIFVPSPVSPADQAWMNYQYPVKLEWAPKGFFEDFDLQVALDSNFSELLVEVSDLKSTVYELNDLKVNNDYYWRVKTYNEAGVSEWSDTAHFMTRAPYIKVNTPIENEVWLRGLDYFIEWEDNIEEDVVLELYKDFNKALTIDTVEIRSAYRWSIPSDLDSACNYHIRISSSADSAVQDVSPITFSINDTSCIGSGVPYLKVIYPNGGEAIGLGEEIIMEWENKTWGVLTVELYKAGIPVSIIHTQVANDTLSWMVPGDTEEGDDYRIWIKSEGGSQLYDASNSDFTIYDYLGIHAESDDPGDLKYKMYPNPANGILNIEYTLETGESLSVKLFNLAGVELETLLNTSTRPGTYLLKHSMENYPSGTYIIQFLTNSSIQSKLLNHLKQ